MMLIGIVWLTGIFALIVMAYIGGTVFNYVLGFFATMTMAPALKEGAGTMFWFLPLYYTIILISGIILTYRCYQETITVVDYYPELGY